MIRVYLDTEFTTILSTKTPKLISLALCSTLGHTFYRELTDTYEKSDCDQFVLDNVLPHLQNEYGITKTYFQVANDLFEFIEELSASGEQVVIVADWHGDFEYFNALMSDVCYAEGEFPNGGIIGLEFIRKMKRDKRFIELFNEHLQSAGAQAHHALADAKANMFAHQKFLEFAK